MKRIIFVFSMILAISAVAAPPDSKGTKTVPRDISGVMGGTFIFNVFPPYGEYDFITVGNATGTLRHLGLAKMHTEHQVNPSGDGTLFNTTFKIVAANGDEIWGTYPDAMVTLEDVGGGPDPPIYLYYKGTATLVILGGTGRFANASGTITATFFETIELMKLDFSEYHCSVAWALDGTVSY